MSNEKIEPPVSPAPDATVDTREDAKDLYAAGLEVGLSLGRKMFPGQSNVFDVVEGVLKLPVLQPPPAKVKAYMGAVVGFLATGAVALIARFAALPPVIALALIICGASVTAAYVVGRLWLTNQDRERAARANELRLKILSDPSRPNVDLKPV